MLLHPGPQWQHERAWKPRHGGHSEQQQQQQESQQQQDHQQQKQKHKQQQQEHQQRRHGVPRGGGADRVGQEQLQTRKIHPDGQPGQ